MANKRYFKISGDGYSIMDKATHKELTLGRLSKEANLAITKEFIRLELLKQQATPNKKRTTNE